MRTVTISLLSSVDILGNDQHQIYAAVSSKNDCKSSAGIDGTVMVMSSPIVTDTPHSSIPCNLEAFLRNADNP